MVSPISSSVSTADDDPWPQYTRTTWGAHRFDSAIRMWCSCHRPRRTLFPPLAVRVLAISLLVAASVPLVANNPIRAMRCYPEAAIVLGEGWCRVHHHHREEGTTMADKQLVLSFFADEPAADSAAMELKDSGITSGDAIGLLVTDAAGPFKVDKVGARSWGAGAGVGACLVLLGPAALGVGVLGGTAAGGLHHKGLKLSDEDKARIAADLGSGKAAWVWWPGPLGAAIQQLTELGGATSSHDVVDEAAVQAGAAEQSA